MFSTLNNLDMNFSFTQTLRNLIKTIVLALLFAVIMPESGNAQNTNNNGQPVFNHAALCAKNLKKTADFYRNVLQLKQIKHPFNDTVHVWLKIGEGLALHIIQGDCSTNVHDIGIHLCFAVPNLDAFIKHLDSMNVSYTNWTREPKKIQLRADGVRQIYLQDPDGFWIEVNDAK
ncbi:MAG: VOC family protein [Mucilaginibacter sp.]